MRLQFRRPISALTTLIASAPHLIFSAASNPYAPVVPSRYATNTALNPLYASSHLPNPLHTLPSLHSCIRFIGYSGLLAYMMNAITEMCLVSFSANRFWGEFMGIFKMLWLGFKS
ncbi:hypothetical protein O181_021268 [Austropuccinia psidii MF-1]|uniref:Uncharacterized protein n=1 Tax=Austropuccinia psidii MF-1 TaxID=1389203 RepID=A0A9Q3GVA2_9BASI|nr:hypothetical protein [Austropuccinia psidii MF-1]